MAEVVININSGSVFEEYDILRAFNNNRIHRCHAEMICALKNFNSDGLRPRGTLNERFLEKTMQYRFERVSRKEVKRTNLWTNEIEIFGPLAMDVELYLEKHLSHSNHKIFGTLGNEVWYSGSMRWDLLDDIWLDIEDSTGLLRAAHDQWPLRPRDLQSFFAITTEDFSDDVAHELESPIIMEQSRIALNDSPPVVLSSNPPNVKILCERKHRIIWDELPGLSEALCNKIRDRSCPVDERRKRAYLVRRIKEEKPFVDYVDKIREGVN